MTSAKARKIQELREALNLSPGELGQRIGVDEVTIRRWEAGDEDPDEEAVNRLADSFGVSQDELRHEDDIRHHPDAP